MKISAERGWDCNKGARAVNERVAQNGHFAKM